MQTKTDFIVIGSGISGLNTALTLAKFGNVLVITKKNLSDSATSFAQGGIASAKSDRKSIKSHISDTLIAGSFHNNKKAVSFLAEEGQNAIKQLISYGVNFNKNSDGTFYNSLEAAHSEPRIYHATDFTGREIEKALISAVKKEKKIKIWEQTFTVDLIVKSKKCYGVQVIRNNILSNVFSKATVLATGGIGQIYKWTTNPQVSTGDGIAMANRAGAELSDLEFIQFHPTALKEKKSPLFLLSEALRGEGGLLIDKTGKRIMEGIHQLKELAPRDIVARTIFKYQQQENVYIDMRHLKKTFIKTRFPNIYSKLLKKGFDLANEPVPVTPAAHFICGGIKTDNKGRTSIKNLFAFGETASTGVHGANRLASNSLLEGIVFSSQIEKSLSNFPEKIETVEIDNKIKNLSNSKSYDYKEAIKNIMWENVGIIRTHQKMNKALNQLTKLKKKLALNSQISVYNLEVENMLETAILITISAEARKKSLGTHYVKPE